MSHCSREQAWQNMDNSTMQDVIDINTKSLSLSGARLSTKGVMPNQPITASRSLPPRFAVISREYALLRFAIGDANPTHENTWPGLSINFSPPLPQVASPLRGALRATLRPLHAYPKPLCATQNLLRDFDGGYITFGMSHCICACSCRKK
jgi:hypothetical protein